ncbi:MAG: hypothetical protein U5K79_03550 [Cyclobacteriaceae bacterium]|nr:hypothetical protein [Cyclobacteriaceae bacterium]
MNTLSLYSTLAFYFLASLIDTPGARGIPEQFPKPNFQSSDIFFLTNHRPADAAGKYIELLYEQCCRLSCRAIVDLKMIRLAACGNPFTLRSSSFGQWLAPMRFFDTIPYQ